MKDDVIIWREPNRILELCPSVESPIAPIWKERVYVAVPSTKTVRGDFIKYEGKDTEHDVPPGYDLYWKYVRMIKLTDEEILELVEEVK